MVITRKKPKCQPQNYNCGRICINGRNTCWVDGLTGQSISIANKLEELVKITKKPKSENKKEVVSELNFQRDGKPLDRIFSNGKKYAESIMNIDEIDSSLSNLSKEELEKVQNKRYDDLDLIGDQMGEIDDELAELEDSGGDPSKIRELNNKMKKLQSEYTELEKAPLTNPVSEKTKNNFNNLLSSLSSRSKINAEEAQKNFNISQNNIPKTRANTVRKNLGQAAELLGLNVQIGVEKSSSRAFAGDGLTQKQKLGARLDSKMFSPEKGRRAIEEIYRKSKSGRINIGNYKGKDDRRVNYHELGHHAEFNNRDIAYANRLWLEKRGTGKIKGMNELRGTKGHRDSEIGMEGSFIDPYVGRIYNKDKEIADISTEVFSMGFQEFTSPENMLELYNKDKEFFFLTVGSILESQGA